MNKFIVVVSCFMLFELNFFLVDSIVALGVFTYENIKKFKR